jgi:hypothetical protein
MENRERCEPGGDSLLVPGQERFLLVVEREGLDVVLKVRSCNSPSDCRTTAGDDDDRQVSDFELTLVVEPDGTLGNQGASAGHRASGDCWGEAWEATAEVRGDRIEVRRRRTIVERYPRGWAWETAPRGPNVGCWTSGTRAAADRLACSRLEQLTAVFVEEL